MSQQITLDDLVINVSMLEMMDCFRIMYNKLMGFLNSNTILYQHQYGFRAKHSTIHPILHFLNHYTEANNKVTSVTFSSITCDDWIVVFATE